MYAKIIHNDDNRKYFLKNQQIISDSLGNGRECRIEGGVANDSVITTVDAYVDGLINAEQAMGKLINEQLRNQICILNQEIIEKYLRFVESIELSD